MAGFRLKSRRMRFKLYLTKYIKNCDWHITTFAGVKDTVDEWTIRRDTAKTILAKFDEVYKKES